MRMEGNFYNQQGKNLEERTQEEFRLEEKRFTKLLVLLKEAKKGKKGFCKGLREEEMPSNAESRKSSKGNKFKEQISGKISSGKLRKSGNEENDWKKQLRRKLYMQEISIQNKILEILRTMINWMTKERLKAEF